MKKIKYLFAALVMAGLTAACDTDVENKVIQNPKTYS